MTAKEKRESMDVLKRVLEEIESEKDKHYIYPKTTIDKPTAIKLRNMGYKVNMEPIRTTTFGTTYGYKISWEKEYDSEELGQDNWS